LIFRKATSPSPGDRRRILQVGLGVFVPSQGNSIFLETATIRWEGKGEFFSRERPLRPKRLALDKSPTEVANGSHLIRIPPAVFQNCIHITIFPDGFWVQRVESEALLAGPAVEVNPLKSTASFPLERREEKFQVISRARLSLRTRLP